MNKNIIWLGIGAVGAYLLLSRKKASATNVEPTKDEKPKDIPKPKDDNALPLPTDAPIGASRELLDALEEVKKLSIGQIMAEYNNLVCRLVTAKIALTPEQSKKREIRIRALRSVAFDRGVKLDCDINKKVSDRFKFSPVYPGNNIPYGAPPIDNIKRLATGIN